MSELESRIQAILNEFGNGQDINLEVQTKTEPVKARPKVEPTTLAVDQVLNCDSLAGLRDLPDQVAHAFVSDIPYGISAEDWDILHGNTNSALLGTSPAQLRAGKIFKTRGKPINGWSEADRAIPREYQSWCSNWAGEWLRILKPGASAVVFAGRRYMHRCICAMEDAGFSLRDILAWDRPRSVYRAQRLANVFERRGDQESVERFSGWRVGNLRPTFEPILWFVKPYKIGTTIADNMLQHGVGAYNEKEFSRYVGTCENIVRIGMQPGEAGLHPTQKPVRLMQALIALVTDEDQLVIDPFAGSGSTLVAAKSLNRRYLGFDLDPKYVEVANSRLLPDLFSPDP